MIVLLGIAVILLLLLVLKPAGPPSVRAVHRPRRRPGRQRPPVPPVVRHIPFGHAWYGYLMRRLAERPANLTFFLRSLVSRN